LGVEGETTWRVPSMAVPPPGADWQALVDYDAARLFLERVGQARPDAPVAVDAATVVQICARLDGIPLALELAAARARSMTLGRIVDELDDRFRLLTGGPRQALARHQTLRASVQWSYDLLDDAERTVLRRLSVFVGGFRAEAAEAVAGFGALAPTDVLPLLARLVERSLVQFDAESDRYRLLETLRQYGRERLEAEGEAEIVADGHLGWACALAEAADPAMTRADLAALDAMEAELPNLRVALDHAVHAQPEAGLRLAAALTFFWSQRGLGLEGADRAERVLVAHPDAPGPLRARAWAACSYDRFYGGDFPGATAAADRAWPRRPRRVTCGPGPGAATRTGRSRSCSTRRCAAPRWPRPSRWRGRAATGGARPTPSSSSASATSSSTVPLRPRRRCCVRRRWPKRRATPSSSPATSSASG